MTIDNLQQHAIAGFITNSANYVQTSVGPYYRGSMVALDIDAFDGSSAMTSMLSPDQYFLEFASKRIKGSIATMHFYGPVSTDGALETLLMLEDLERPLGFQKVTELTPFERSLSDVKTTVRRAIRDALEWTINGIPEIWSYGSNYTRRVPGIDDLALAFKLGGRELLGIEGSKGYNQYTLLKARPSFNHTNVSVGFIAGLTPGITLNQDALRRFTQNPEWRVTQESNRREIEPGIERALRRNMQFDPSGGYGTSLRAVDGVESIEAMRERLSLIEQFNNTQTIKAPNKWIVTGSPTPIPLPDIAKPAVPYDPTAPRKRPL